MTEFFFDPTHNVLVYPRSDIITRVIPEAREFNGHYVGVPRTLRNSQILAHYNYPIVPVMDNYDWPIEPGRKPLPHQKIYANFQVTHPRCFNLGDPGTMKTLSSLWAMSWLMQQHPKGTFKALIICPLTIIETGWAKAIFRNFLGRLTFEILHGTPEKRLALLNKNVDCYLINFEGPGIGAHTRKRFELDGFSKVLAARDDIKLVIIDESRAYGDATSKRSRLARAIFGNRPYQWQLCGSPTPQAPTDCYGMAKLLNNAYGKSFTTFQAETMYKLPHSAFRWVPQRDGYIKARRILTPAIRFALDEIWQGPEQTIQEVHIALSDEQKKLLADLKRDLTMLVKSGQVITAANEAAARLKLLQICAGAVYDENHKKYVVDCTSRLTEIKRIIDSTQRKVVIFVNFTSVIHMLQRHLTETWRKQHSTLKCGVINGAVSDKDRVILLNTFGSDPDLKVMIVDPTTTAHGINEFVAADTGIWAGPCDRTELWIQGNARIRRPGQTFPSTIFQLFSTPTEQEMFRRLENNTSMQGLMLDMVRKGEL
jgi:hypothetical protein